MAALFGSPDLPEGTSPTPLPGDAQLTQARRRRLAEEVKQSGAVATVLSQPGAREALG
jgi:hypothetical protein